MIRWTTAGAVSSPTALQLRISPGFPGRVAAGAPSPSRSLSVDEVFENLAHFTKDRVGPRTRAVDLLVLSGPSVEVGESLPDITVEARAMGISRVILHAGSTRDLRWGAHTDAVVLAVHEPQGAQAWPNLVGAGCVAVVMLHAEVVERLRSTLEEVVAKRPERVVLLWPFPTSEQIPPPAREVVAALRRCVEVLHGLRWSVKGLPSCVLRELHPHLPDVSRHLGRTRNRWYVDAEHQRAGAMVFFPDLVRWARPEGCRSCVVAHRCDGVAEAWLLLGLAGPLTPLIEDPA